MPPDSTFVRATIMRKPKFPATLPDDASFDELKPKLTAPANALRAPDPDLPTPLRFTPVPRLRTRRHGWGEERQRAFIVALARCGSVSAAARHVGMTARSAYRLLDAPGADSFAQAWDAAVDEGMERLRSSAFERAMHGGFVPIYRRGKLVRVEHRHNDRLAIAMLGGRPTDVETYRRTALSRVEHRSDLAELDAARADRHCRHDEADRAFEQQVDALVDRLRTPAPRNPSIRSL